MQSQEIIFRLYRELENSMSVHFDAFADVKKKLRSLTEPKEFEPTLLEQRDSQE